MNASQYISIYYLEERFQDYGICLKTYDYPSHIGELSDGQIIRLPLQLSVENLEPKLLDDKTFIVLIVQSGEAVIGLVEDGELTYHKVFRGYLVRKKQGKSQLKHLKTKGKSRAGSRIRLASTFGFLEGINDKLDELFSENDIERIVFHCSELLKPHFFDGNKSFTKQDERLFSLAMNVESPSYEFLEKVVGKYVVGEIKKPQP